MDREDMPDNDACESEFIRLITSHQLDIYLYVHSLFPSPHEASEIVQDTNVVLWEKRGQFAAGTNFRAWAFQIARYKLLEHRARRKQQGRCFSDSLINELAIQAPQYARSENDEQVERLRLCMAKLPANDRELLGQRYSSSASCASIARKIGRPVSWVYNSLRRIRHELLDCVANSGTKTPGNSDD